MKTVKLVSPIIAGAILLGASGIRAQEVALAGGWKAPADTKELPGQIVRPLICPQDTTWLSFEVRYRDAIRLYVYNSITAEMRELQPPRLTDSFDDEVATVSPVNRGFAWQPVSLDGKLWSAFVSNATGSDELHVYDVLADEYFMLIGQYDSSGVGSKRDAGWTPDGYCLTYTSTARGDADIYIIRGMDKVLKDPTDEKVPLQHRELVVDDGDQFGGVWCPVAQAGYLAYNHIEKGSDRVEIRIWDPRLSTAYGLVGGSSSTGYFAPSWSPTGSDIAYYQYPVSRSSSRLGNLLEPGGDSYSLGLASVRIDNDSLVFTPQRGGKTLTNDAILKVAPNIDRYRGPAWLPDGKRLLVSKFDEPAQNPLKVIFYMDWIQGSRQRDWLSSFGGGAFEFPRDASVTNRSLTFSYTQAQKRILLMGQLESHPSFDEPLVMLNVPENRKRWWPDYRTDITPGFLTKTWRWLRAPVAGPNFVVNSRGIVLSGILTAAVVILTGGDDLPPRVWTPPRF